VLRWRSKNFSHHCRCPHVTHVVCSIDQACGGKTHFCIYQFRSRLPLGCSYVRMRENDFREDLQGAQIWASYRNIFHNRFVFMFAAPPWTMMFNSNHWSELTAGIIVVGRCGRSWYMRNRYLCRQLRLGKNRSHQFVSIDLCLCYVCIFNMWEVGVCKCLLPIGTVSARGPVPTI
jgi:hypothetical protein